MGFILLLVSLPGLIGHLDHLIGIGASDGHCNLTIPSVNHPNLPLVLEASLAHYYSRHQHHPGHWGAHVCTFSLKPSAQATEEGQQNILRILLTKKW